MKIREARAVPNTSGLPDVLAKVPVRWAGGKRSLLPELLARTPMRGGTYYEPFAGGAALFFAVSQDRARYFCNYALNDANAELMEFYGALRSPAYAKALIASVKKHFRNSERGYKQARDNFATSTGIAAAARFFFLNKTCFNGLYRVNREGAFNVSYGHRPWKVENDVENLLNVAQLFAAREPSLDSLDFERAVSPTIAGDFVYFDPPYLPTSETSDFTSYTPGRFGLADHARLRDVALGLKARGVQVLLSNSSAPAIRELYADNLFSVEEVSGARNVAANGKKRGPVTDLLIR